MAPSTTAWTRELAEGEAAVAGGGVAVGRCERWPPRQGWSQGRQPGLEHHKKAAYGCPGFPALSPGLSALLRLYSEFPTHTVVQDLPYAPKPDGSPAATGPLSTVPSLCLRQPQLGRGAGTSRSQAGGEQAGRSRAAAPSSIRRTPRSEASMKYSCSKWCNFVCIQPTSCIFQSIMK